MEILPLLIGLEPIRKDKFIAFVIVEIFLVAALTTAIVFFVNALSAKYGPSSMMLVSVLPIVTVMIIFIIIYYAYKQNSAFVKLLKASCLNKVLKFYNNMHVIEDFPFTSTELEECNLFSNYTNINSGDKFKGSHNGVEYRIAETELRYIAGSGKSRTDIQIFKGVIFSFPMNKTVNTNAIVAIRGDRNIKNNPIGVWSAVLSMGYGWFNYFLAGIKDGYMLFWLIVITLLLAAFFVGSITKKSKLKEVKLEDPEFAKKFRIYSQDQIEARYLITTAFMERFLRLNTAFGTRKAKCAFYKNQIIFAISTRKNLFEIGSLFTPLKNPNHLSEFYKELSSILFMIDYFKLDEKIGL